MGGGPHRTAGPASTYAQPELQEPLESSVLPPGSDGTGPRAALRLPQGWCEDGSVPFAPMVTLQTAASGSHP